MSGRSSNAKRKRHDYALKKVCNALGGKGMRTRNKKAYDQALQAMLASFIVPALRPTRKLPSGAGTGVVVPPGPSLSTGITLACVQI